MAKITDKPRATKNHDLRESRAGKAPDLNQTQPTQTDEQSRRAGASDGNGAEEGNDEGNDDFEADELDVEKDVDDSFHAPKGREGNGQGPSGAAAEEASATPDNQEAEADPLGTTPATLQQLLDLVGIQDTAEILRWAREKARRNEETTATSAAKPASQPESTGPPASIGLTKISLSRGKKFFTGGIEAPDVLVTLTAHQAHIQNFCIPFVEAIKMRYEGSINRFRYKGSTRMIRHSGHSGPPTGTLRLT